MTLAALEIYQGDRWTTAADVELRGDEGLGWAAPTTCSYHLDYAIAHTGRRDAAALSANMPVSIEHTNAPTWPPFLLDMLPQGFGRVELLRQLGLPETAAAGADWRLLMAGAGNPIGNVRVAAAAESLARHATTDRQGFSFDDVVQRDGSFMEHLARHGLFVGGSSGVQGEWPKLLLTEAHDGLFYLDHALPDADAARHWLVKFSRGADPSLATILRVEAPYMALARHLGLHVHGDMAGDDTTLFIPRFDREVVNGRVLRHGQESLASLCGLAGFGLVPSHNEACRRLAAVSSAPAVDVLEYVRRDIANIVLGNKDNHARNTAIQRRDDGTVRLSPLFDFAPMMLHPDGIARRTRWAQDDGAQPRWASVAAQVAESAGMDEGTVRDAMKAMLPALRELPGTALSLGVDQRILDMQHFALTDTVTQLETL